MSSGATPADGSHSSPAVKGVPNKNLVLAAMVFAVAMTFIDQTIVAIAIPKLQKDLSLSATGSQWIINGYLIALSALFAFGGKLGDVLGRRRMVVIGVVGFALASTGCGFTPTGSIAEPWIITFRVLQGAAAALMFPAAVGIVVASFPLRERGQAMAIFFGISGGLTAIGPIAGGFLTQWTWRSIFWINVPVAIIALILIWKSKPDNVARPTKLDYRGTVLITGAMGLVVLGLQQSSVWGWSEIATWVCIVAGLLLAALFVRHELRTPVPLLRLQIFADRGFATESAVLGLMSVVFVPFFFFASVYAQGALGQTASNAGLYILYFFIGFVIASQIGGRILDTRGAKPAVVGGSALGAVGFFLLAGKLTDLSMSAQWIYIALAGAGIGLMLGVASTDAVNRAPSSSYSEVTGITQTARNFGASLGLAVLGTVLISRNETNVTHALTKHGVPQGVAHGVASKLESSGGGGAGSSAGQSHALVHDVQLAFAHSTSTVFYIMAGVMAATCIVALRWLPSGRVEVPDQAEVPVAPANVGA
ncbi:MAG TPA: MFS transporter [Solirubrobacteraceae bacterium]|jgi:EmrB/QacA subfamily drug resistance transporter